MAAPRIFPVIWLIVESSSSTSVSRSKAQAVRDRWRNRKEATEQSEVTAKHGATEQRRRTEGGSTGVAKRRALPDRIGNTSAIPARSVRVSDPIQQRQVGLLRGPTVEPLFSVRLRCSVAPCLAVRSVASASCLPLTVDHSSRAIHQPGHVEVDQQG